MRFNNRLKLITIWKNGLILIGITLLSLATFRPVLACSPGATDSTSVSTNGKYVLVLYLVAQDQAIRAKYPAAGLYPNDGSNIALWTFSDRARLESSQIFISEDGQNLVAISNTGPQVWFYKAGRLLNEYDEKYFGIAAQKCFTDWLKTTTYDRALEQVSIETTSNSTYEFDLNTGKVLHADSTPGFAFFLGPALGALGIVALVLVVSLLAKLRKNKSSTR
jgi:hypothetical protein